MANEHNKLVEDFSSLLEKMSKFDKLVGKLVKKGKDMEKAKGLAASIGRKKLGKAAFQAKAEAGKKD